MPIRLAALLLLALAAPAQSLARPGWAGSGLSLEPWWAHAVLYRVDPHSFSKDGLAGVTKQLDIIHSLGVDAITLTHLQPQDGPARLQTIDPALGTLENFDDLLREAGRSGLRVLIELAPTPADDLPALEAATRWLCAHGASGISIPAALPSGQLQSLHRLLHSLPGQRILVAASDAELSPHPLPEATAASLRSALPALQSPASLVWFEHISQEAAKPLAAVLLLTHANAQLVAGQEIMPLSDLAAQDADPESLLNWYRRLIDLHHGNAAMRSGTDEILDHDADNALVWVIRRPQITPQTPAIIVACNLADKPVTLSLIGDLAALHLRGSFLRPVLRSGAGMGGMSLNAVTLPPFGVYIGELRF